MTSVTELTKAEQSDHTDMFGSSMKLARHDVHLASNYMGVAIRYEQSHDKQVRFVWGILSQLDDSVLERVLTYDDESFNEVRQRELRA